MDQDKESDRISEDSYFLEGVQQDVPKKAVSKRDVPEKDALERDTSERDAPLRHKGPRKEGRKFVFFMVFLLVGFAFPLLLVYLIKWPHPAQHLLIFGISYYKLLYIYFLSSALLIHASLFFLRARPLVVLVFFLLSLFCCLPFIMGLRNNLTLYQVIGDLPFFYEWPFFLNPSYIMIEFLLPIGVVMYLFLQIKNILSGGTRGYGFLCVGIYLSIAAVLGLFGLNEANQPNITTALAGIKDYFANGPLHLGANQEIVRQPISEREGGVELPSRIKYAAPASRLQRVEPLKNGDDPVSVSGGVRQLVEKVGVIEAQIKEIRTLLLERKPAPQEEKPVSDMEKTTVNEIPADRSAIMELEGRIRLLSEEVGAISAAVEKMAPVLPMAAEEPALKTDVAGDTKVEEKAGDMEKMYPY
ncbi:MAG TPA: hypothetical protein HPP58_00155 [Deltaproteobacteria bacterium]|nr:hypothetical protein [Deltaproteobacteria bacterium]HIJ35669.1 hypothetical protein [Deltaproteobacteria bacterium]HIJ39456.1 hypothetical protein [Deltaproteobacteria bacterium]